MAVDWSTLPDDLVGEIAIKLESCDDFIYFSTVCRSWNRASSLIKNLWTATPVPWLLLAQNTEINHKCPRNIFKLNNNKRYSLNLPEMYGARCWGSPYGWVAMVKHDLSVQLFNPITKANISFPSLQTIPSLPIYEPPDNEVPWFDYNEWLLAAFLQKVIVLKVSQAGGHHEFVIMLLSVFMKGPIFAKHGDQSWTTILIKEPKVSVFDVVVMDDLVFALYGYEGAIAYWSVTEFYGLGVVKPMVYLTGKYRIFASANSAYLVQSGSDLLLVIRFKLGQMDLDDIYYDDYEIAHRTIDFKIYKLNPNDKNWESVEDLGDVALFVGENSSMAVSSAHAKGLQRSCIYFTDDESEVWLYPSERTLLAGHDMSVFDIKTNMTELFYEDNDTRSSVCSPTWFVPHF
ncbi:F-box protein At2g17036-like [Silene latifolia]|uniref:F-box protein At2g17036-like n=1 Tax=Silene latifolia TaxID=37657 RepID=UPI003D76B5B5